jgi:opacity protein-like surface antigen
MKKIIYILALILLSASSTFAQEDSWEFALMPYAWLAGIDGDIEIRNASYSFDVDFKDIFEALNFGLMARFEAHKGKWGFFLDPMYMSLEGEDITTRLSNVYVVPSTKIVMADVGASYQLGESEDQAVTFEIMGGLRYLYFKGELDYSIHVLSLSAEKSPDTSTHAAEPIIGGRIKWAANDKWTFILRGDIGGDFGLADRFSLFNWNLVAGIDYKLNENTSLNVGYRILDIDFEFGEGATASQLDARLHGPGIGATFRF